MLTWKNFFVFRFLLFLPTSIACQYFCRNVRFLDQTRKDYTRKWMENSKIASNYGNRFSSFLSPANSSVDCRFLLCNFVIFLHIQSLRPMSAHYKMKVESENEIVIFLTTLSIIHMTCNSSRWDDHKTSRMHQLEQLCRSPDQSRGDEGHRFSNQNPIKLFSSNRKWRNLKFQFSTNFSKEQKNQNQIFDDSFKIKGWDEMKEK